MLDALTEEFVEETRAFWSRRLGRDVSADEARRIIRSHVALFRAWAEGKREAG